MLQMVVRYGLLLALFLIVLDVAQRSFFMRMMGTETYVGVIAITFLVFGAWLALKIYRPIKKQPSESPGIHIKGNHEFSNREAEVLLFLCHGFTNKEIAQKLQITTNTVKTHLKNIYGKLGVNNRTQAAAEAKMLNIINS